MAWSTTGTLNSPSNIGWAIYQATNKNCKKITPWTCRSGNSSQPAYIYWESGHYTFHVQYRYRRRWSPAKCKTAGLDMATDKWDDWTEWNKINWTEDGDTAVTPCYKYNCDPTTYEPPTGQAGGTTCTTQQNFLFASSGTYPYDEYDEWEWEVWVRAADRQTRTCSAWATTTLTVVYAAYVDTPTTITRKANGDLYLTINPHWQRDDNRVTVRGNIASGGGDAFSSFSHVRGGEGTYIMGSSLWSNYSPSTTTLKFLELRYVNSDKVITYLDGTTVSVVDEMPPTTELPEPTLDAMYYEDFAVIQFRVGNSTEFDSALAQLTFTNSAGNRVTTDLDCIQGKSQLNHIVDADKNFYAWYYQPIFDIPMTLSLTGIKDSVSRTSKFAVTVHSYGMVWSNGDFDDIARAPYNIGVDEDLDFDTDSIKTALGTRPVMRYGTGGERTIKASCATIRQSTHSSKQRFNPYNGSLYFEDNNIPTGKITTYSYQTKETTVKNTYPYAPWRTAESDKPSPQTTANRIVERLKQPHDWVFRAPHGVWYNVAVTAVNRSWDYSTQLDTVDVTMQEVDNDS